MGVHLVHTGINLAYPSSIKMRSLRLALNRFSPPTPLCGVGFDWGFAAPPAQPTPHYTQLNNLRREPRREPRRRLETHNGEPTWIFHMTWIPLCNWLSHKNEIGLQENMNLHFIQRTVALKVYTYDIEKKTSLWEKPVEQKCLNFFKDKLEEKNRYFISKKKREVTEPFISCQVFGPVGLRRGEAYEDALVFLSHVLPHSMWKPCCFWDGLLRRECTTCCAHV